MVSENEENRNGVGGGIPVADRDNASFDEEMLRHTLEDTTRWSYGIVWAEVWLLSEDRQSLCLPNAGCYVDPIFSKNNSSDDHDDPVHKLTDPSCEGYIPPKRVVVGEGLPGTLWAEDKTGRHKHMSRQLAGLHTTNTNNYSLSWRNLDDISNDPHKAWNPRLRQLSLSGLGWATAVPLYFEGEKQGIVIYMARRTVDLDRLRSPTNDDYLHSAANLVAATLAIRVPRKRVVKERREEHAKCLRRIRVKLAAISFFGHSIHDVMKRSEKKALDRGKSSFGDWRKDVSSFLLSPSNSDSTSFRAAFGSHFRNECVELSDRFVNAVKKCKGAAVPLPPAFGWVQTVHSFFGCFATLLMLTYVNKVLVGSSKGDAVTLILGPFGALATLIFGLTAAPAAQPRNAVLGQFVSITVVLLMRSLPLVQEVRISLSVALAIGAMCKLGLTHPPAGASAMVFASSDSWGFSHMGILLVGNVLTILAAAFINNWSDQRQYPTFWGFGDLRGLVGQLLEKIQNNRRQTKSQMKEDGGDTEYSHSASPTADYGAIRSMDIEVDV